MKTHRTKIEIPKSHLESYELMLDYGEKELIEYGIHRLDNIKTWSGTFDDGKQVDIKLNSSEDDVWTECVMFTEEGSECCVSSVWDEIRGEWNFLCDGEEYIVEVVGV